MRVVEHDPGRELGLAFAERDEPEPAPHEVLVDVRATSLNFGEVAYVGKRAPGYVPGWDAAGVVARAAADGSGPAVGEQVLTFGWSGAWAQRRVVEVGELAVVPDGVDLAVAATLPVAGVTALRAVRALGSVVGRTVLVTGASGGVGRFAVQFAAAAGARVLGLVSRPERGEGLERLGVDRVVPVADLAGLDEPVHGVVENVGGQVLADVALLAEPGSLVVSVGAASLELATIDFEAMRVRGGRTRIEAFSLGSGLGPDLALLLGLLRDGRLVVDVDRRVPFDGFLDAAADLLGRRTTGKIVVELP